MRNNIGCLLSKRAAITPDDEAFVEWERQRRFSFLDLNRRANRVADALVHHGIQPGDRVATLLKNGIEFIETYYAVAKIGAVLVPLNWRLTGQELAYILGDSGAMALVFDQQFDSVVGGLQAARLACRLWWRCSLDTGDPALPCDNYEEILSAAADEEPPIGAADQDNLFIMYTSGTTGQPKGAVHSHDGMLWSHFTSMATADLRSDDRFLLPLPMFHVGCLNPVSLLVHRGATGIIVREPDMGTLLRSIVAEQVTIFMTVPVLLQTMLDTLEQERHDLSSVRTITTGASPVPVSLLKRWAQLGIAIQQGYGLTESCGPGTLLLHGDAIAHAGSCGKPQMHTDALIIDGEGRPVPMGSPLAGELLLSGRHIMKGYWNNPEATADVLRGGWLHTGDICTWDAEGFITVCDRKKDMIISGGENIYPAELENVLAACPEVQEAAVIGLPSAKWGETPLALVVPARGHQPTPESLLAWCREHLAGYKVPRLYELVDALPRNPSGKLLKPALRERYPGPAPF